MLLSRTTCTTLTHGFSSSGYPRPLSRYCFFTTRFNIVMVIFDISQSVVNSVGGVIAGCKAASPDMLDILEAQLMTIEIGPILGLWMQSFLIRIVIVVINIVVFVIACGRIIAIYLLTSLAPVTMATLFNREIGGMGQNYLKALCAVGFQGLLILVCMEIYAKLVQNITVGGNPIGTIWTVIGYTLLLCFTIFKTGSLAKSIFGEN